jgi:hypothetical protein
MAAIQQSIFCGSQRLNYLIQFLTLRKIMLGKWQREQLSLQTRLISNQSTKPSSFSSKSSSRLLMETETDSDASPHQQQLLAQHCFRPGATGRAEGITAKERMQNNQLRNSSEDSVVQASELCFSGHQKRTLTGDPGSLQSFDDPVKALPNALGRHLVMTTAISLEILMMISSMRDQLPTPEPLKVSLTPSAHGPKWQSLKDRR